MRRSILVIALLPLLLALSAADADAQAATVHRIHGSDERGRFDVSWVKLADGVGERAAREKVNAELEREARWHICDPEPDPERRRHLESWYQMEVTYRNSRLLGIRTFQDNFCGGNHPNHGTHALLYDLRTGARLELEREMADPASFRRFVAKRAAANAPKDADDCAALYTAEVLAATGYVYLLRDHDLVAMQDYPHVSQACAFDTAIPYADVVPFVRPGSPLRTLGQR